MKDYEQKIAELESLMTKDDEVSAKRRDELSNWFKTHRSPEAVEAFEQFLQRGYNAILDELREMNQQLKETGSYAPTMSFEERLHSFEPKAVSA